MTLAVNNPPPGHLSAATSAAKPSRTGIFTLIKVSLMGCCRGASHVTVPQCWRGIIAMGATSPSGLSHVAGVESQRLRQGAGIAIDAGM